MQSLFKHDCKDFSKTLMCALLFQESAREGATDNGRAPTSTSASLEAASSQDIEALGQSSEDSEVSSSNLEEPGQTARGQREAVQARSSQSEGRVGEIVKTEASTSSGAKNESKSTEAGSHEDKGRIGETVHTEASTSSTESAGSSAERSPLSRSSQTQLDNPTRADRIAQSKKAESRTDRRVRPEEAGRVGELIDAEASTSGASELQVGLRLIQ